MKLQRRLLRQVVQFLASPEIKAGCMAAVLFLKDHA